MLKVKAMYQDPGRGVQNSDSLAQVWQSKHQPGSGGRAESSNNLGQQWWVKAMTWDPWLGIRAVAAPVQ